MANTLIFFAENMWVAFAMQKLLHSCSKNISVFENTVATIVNEFVMNELVKLRCFEQLGPEVCYQIIAN